jgi:thiol-disulfide isomerase/thioredoxin
MFSKPISDCGCGGGTNCITKHKKQFRAWVAKELKRLDCGCGCKGKKKFEEKYGPLVGGKLKDCPPGWRNDGLTCVENCRPDEFDDGLTCRKKCEPGFIDDGLTCRKPITSSIDPCPDGSQDVAGTCWGDVRQDCIDDCFKHPAPGCRTYECGRLKGAFGEDWGPKLCTDCNLRCGQTCWGVKGITRQLHERNLRLSGGEVVLQAIRGKRIEGRVDWEATIAEIQSGLQDVFSADSGLAKLFDPEKNGVAAALRKFGDDTKGAFEEIGRKTKDAFDKMGADAKAAFEKFARDAEGNLTNLLGKEFMDKMKDPKFWIEAAAIMAQVGATILGVLVTAGTLGVGAAAGAAIIMAGNMAAPAIRMIGKAAMGEPIDALDIADMALSAIPAPGPGKAATSFIGKAAQAVIRNGSTIKTIGGLVISGVKAGQTLGIIPSSCLGPNCPPPPPPAGPPEGPEDYTDPPKPPSDQPPPAGQLSDEEIIALQPEDTIQYKIRVNGVKVINPKYIPSVTWINQYRLEHYGTPTTNDAGALVSPNDAKIENIPNAVPQEPVELPEAVTLEGDVIEPFSFDDEEEEILPFTFDGEGEEEGEQVNIEGEVVPEPVPIPVEPPKALTKPPESLTDDEILELQPADTVNKKIKVDGKKIDNPKYIPGVTWIEQYKAKLAKLPEEPQTTGELIAQGVEPIEAVDQTQAEEEAITAFEAPKEEAPEEEIVPFSEEAPEEEIVPFSEEAEEEIVPFSEEAPEEEIVPFSEEAPEQVGMQLDEVLPFVFEEEEAPAAPVAPAAPIKVGDQTIFPDQYVVERLDDQCCQRQFQEDELIGGAEGDEIEPFLDGDVLSNPFGSLKTTKEYPFIPKTHKGNNFIVDCYAAKNPEVAKAMKDDPDRLTSHWIEEGAKQGLDADCGPATTTIEERLAIMQEVERKRIELEGRKTNCAATDRFWVERGEKPYCDGKRTAKGERRGEAYACEEKGNYWDSDYGFKFCNKFLDVDGKPKSGKEFCSSKNHYWDGNFCDDTKNLDGTPKRMGDFCQDLGLKYENDPQIEKDVLGVKLLKSPRDISDQKLNTVCNTELLDINGEPIDFEKMCVDTVSYYNKENKTCDINRFPNGESKPNEFKLKNVIRDRNYLAMPYDKDSLREYYNSRAPKDRERGTLLGLDKEFDKREEETARKRVIEISREILELFNINWAVQHYAQDRARQGGDNGFVRPYYDPEFRQSTPKDKEEWEREQKIKWITRWYWEGKWQGIPGDKHTIDTTGIDPGIFIRWFNLFSNKNLTRSGGVPFNTPEQMKEFNEGIFGKPIEGKGKGRPSLTLHWADWCPHCHDMMPEWKKLGSEHKGIQILAVEQKQSGFKGPFPTILFRNGNSMEKYEGPRTKAAFVKFLKNKLA